MKATHLHGDITEIEKFGVYNPNALNSVTHCCNTLGAYNAGLAKQIRAKYPIAYTEYKQFCEQHGSNVELLGKLQVVMITPSLAICNLFGQLEYGRHKRQLNYEALYCGLEYQASVAKTNPNMEFYYPYLMGCDNAGGNWAIVENIINVLFSDLPNAVYIVEYDKK